MKEGLIRLPMTNKELERLLRVGILLAGLILGLAGDVGQMDLFNEVWGEYDK